MILNLTSANFALDTGFYYSTPILVGTDDTLMTIEIQLVGNGDASLQQSIEGTRWYDVPDSTITCAPYGMQSFIESQPELQFRLKSTVNFVFAKILI